MIYPGDLVLIKFESMYAPIIVWRRDVYGKEPERIATPCLVLIVGVGEEWSDQVSTYNVLCEGCIGSLLAWVVDSHGTVQT